MKKRKKSKNFVDSKGKIHWQYIKIVFHTIEFLLWRHTSCSTSRTKGKSTFRMIVVLEVVPSPPDQLDTKVFLPSRGRNPSLNGRFCHQKVESSLIKIGKGRIWDLTGDVPFPYLVQRPSKGEILWRPDPAGTEMSLRRIYAGQKYPHVYTLSISTGKNQWRKHSGNTPSNTK